jgi:hypothetical protein
MTTPTQEQLEALWDLCKNKIDEHNLCNGEILADLDKWECHSYYWLHEICDVVGWKPYEEEDA